MKTFAYAAILALAAGMIVVPVQAAGDDDKKFTIHGELRTRWEYVENLTDLTDNSNGQFDDEFSFMPYRARIAVHGQFSNNVSGYIEMQNFGNFGNDAPLKGSDDPLGQSFGNIDDSEIDLYQAFIDLDELGGSAFSLRIGRQEVTLGTELFLGDNDYYNGLSFDGITGGWAFESWTLNFGYLTINDRNFGTGPNCLFSGPTASCGDDNVDLWTVSSEFAIGDNGQEIEPYILYYRDGMGGLDGIRTYTVGARWSRDVGHDDDSLIDWNLEGAFQTGEIDPNGADLDHEGSIIEGWIGFNFKHGDNAGSRVWVGALITSGDDDPLDSDNEGFFPLFGDIHSNNRLGNIDFGGGGALAGIANSSSPGDSSGITDFNVGYNGYRGDHMFLAAVHLLTATEDDSLPGQEDDLGQVLDLAYGYNYTSNLSFGVEVSFFSAGDLPEEQLMLEDDGLRIAGQVRLRF